MEKKVVLKQNTFVDKDAAKGCGKFYLVLNLLEYKTCFPFSLRIVSFNFQPLRHHAVNT